VDLQDIFSSLPEETDPRVIVGFRTSDDAGVYRIGTDRALIHTVDFIPPVCDDPEVFGQIAAANALSDVFAMGGRVLSVLNICAFPPSGIPNAMLSRILEGGASKVREAGGVVLGGHTVTDKDLKFGLAVTGEIHPDAVITNAGAQPGNRLVLTKPLGIGAIVTANKRGKISDSYFQEAVQQMVTLNQDAAVEMSAAGATACTDITGFGLLGHGLELAQASGVGLRIRFQDLPLYDIALKMLAKGHECAPTNWEYVKNSVRLPDTLKKEERFILHDPQTSGGLLVVLPADAAAGYVERMHGLGHQWVRDIGEVFEAGEPVVEVI
jgi:selenide, water dikinase